MVCCLFLRLIGCSRELFNHFLVWEKRNIFFHFHFLYWIGNIWWSLVHMYFLWEQKCPMESIDLITDVLLSQKTWPVTITLPVLKFHSRLNFHCSKQFENCWKCNTNVQWSRLVNDLPWFRKHMAQMLKMAQRWLRTDQHLWWENVRNRGSSPSVEANIRSI